MNITDLQYYRTINRISSNQSCKDLLISEMTEDYNNARENAIYRFNVLINSIDAKDVYINDNITSIKGVIDVKRQQTADTEMQEVVQVYPNQIKQGDYIKFKINDTDILRTYLIKSRIEKKHGYDEGVFLECNHKFKWMYKNVLHEAWGIGTNQTKYTLGTDSVQAGLTESDSRYSIQMSNNENNKTLKVGQRLIFNEGAWKVTQIEYVSSQDNIRSILLGQDSINSEIDDVENEIAGAYENLHTYTYNIPSSFEVANGSGYTLNYSIKDETGKDFDYSLITVTTTDNTLINLINTNGVISITGLNVGVGSIKLSVPSGSTSTEFVVNFEVKDVVADKIEYTTNFSQGTTIKQYVTSTLNCTKTVNSVVVPLNISCSWDTTGQSLIGSGKLTVITKSSSSIAIKNVGVTSNTVAHLTVMDTDTGVLILDNIDIVLSGM